MSVDNQSVPMGETVEYTQLYAHFAELVRGRRSDVELAPLQLVADAFLCGPTTEVDPFIE